MPGAHNIFPKHSQSQRLIQFRVGQQPGIRRDLETVKLQLQTTIVAGAVLAGAQLP